MSHKSRARALQRQHPGMSYQAALNHIRAHGNAPFTGTISPVTYAAARAENETEELARHLRAVLELLVPEKWAKGARAKNERGEPVSPLCEDACYWCLLGAIELVTSPANQPDRARRLLIDALVKELAKTVKDADVVALLNVNDTFGLGTIRELVAGALRTVSGRASEQDRASV